MAKECVPSRKKIAEITYWTNLNVIRCWTTDILIALVHCHRRSFVPYFFVSRWRRSLCLQKKKEKLWKNGIQFAWIRCGIFPFQALFCKIWPILVKLDQNLSANYWVQWIWVISFFLIWTLFVSFLLYNSAERTKIIINDDSHPKFILSYINPICPSFFIKSIFLNFHFWKNLNFCSENWLHLFSSLWIS